MENPIIFTFDENRILSGIAGQDSPIAIHQLEPSHHDTLQTIIPNQRLRLIQLFRKIYHEELLLDPNSRKVIICEDFRMSNPSKQLLSRVFLYDLLVPAVFFIPSSVLYLLSHSLSTGIVIGIGLEETVVIPIYDFRIITPQIMITDRALARITTHIQSLSDLENFATQDDNEVSILLGTTNTRALSKKTLDYLPNGTLEESVRSVLFSSDSSMMNDDNEFTIPEILRKITARLPIDIRSEIINSVVLAGPLTSAPGFAEMFSQELSIAQLSLLPLSRKSKPLSDSSLRIQINKVLSSDDMDLWTTTSAYVSTIVLSDFNYGDSSIFANEIRRDNFV
ncbi:hypothetical protein NADFUDRAFT_50328 [Nadsonia fulvescens var. elongata DSM 6958]|uniref:Actin-like ATPase domain-containing protein n=1 Tax=Nadsonia fulvescens var. elongata DSM 6958 TaxID=857566 RepID=A0A1E3PLV2_9ASCO|nr:hypothetical protein NADFUDRAFT_50328 [Nadsonia fulvescens var. elongata DSM 6958]